MIRKVIAPAILLLVVACTPALVVTPPTEPIQIGFYSVVPQTEWNRATRTNNEVWTIDGYALQEIQFLDVADGQPLWGKPDKEGKTPVFRKSMLPNEIQEFVVETLAASGWAQVKPAGLKPAKFGGLPGFRFSFGMVSDDGLEYDGVVLGTVKDDALHVIMYSGTRLHYFPEHAKQVEQLFASIRT